MIVSGMCILSITFQFLVTIAFVIDVPKRACIANAIGRGPNSWGVVLILCRLA